MQKIVEFVERNREKHVEDLVEFVKIPSISSSAEHRGEVGRCAEYLAERMRGAGMKTARVYSTPGHPIVFGEYVSSPSKPTVLIYGHYDVQPVDPLDLWSSPPFEPVVRDGNLYGRGTVDDKGQVYAHLKAMEAYLAASGDLPLNVKMVVEGEEEIGSENLERFLETHKEMLAADWVVISDTPMFGKNMPSICYGLRGICYMEIEVKGPEGDLHSGSFGGVVANPLQVLAEIVTSMKDKTGRVQIPGFYDDVVPVSQKEREALARLPFEEAELKRIAAVPLLTGEIGYTHLERMWARPTLDCNGIWGGFTGEGSKTIIPSWGKAKISMRLVPNQNPEKIAKLFEQYVNEVAPPTVRVTVVHLHGGNGFLAPIEDPAVQATARALERAFGVPAYYIREGGSIPFVATIHGIFKKPCLLMGFGLPDENSHAPNEHIYLENYHKGILSAAFLYDELARLPR